ncbi:flavodoxin family protein [Deltaproteobacteria bacterium TL4]
MKKILGIIGSPRKSGNCETMVKAISRNIQEEHELRLIRLQDFNIKSCNACYNCLFQESCLLKDDFYTVLDQIKEADALIIAAPAYLFGANASIKNFLDRGLALFKHRDQIWEKPAVAVAIAGMEGKEGRTLLDLEGFLMGLGTTMMKSGIIFAALPGEVMLNEKIKQIAKDYAEALFADEPERKEVCCPLCGGQSFRFSGGDRVLCLLCSNRGRIEIKSGVPKFQMEAGNDIVLSHHAVEEHGKWLMGMKSRFLTVKDQLKEIRDEYKNDGVWIKPSKKKEDTLMETT